MEKDKQIIKKGETYSLVLGKINKTNVTVMYFTDKGVICKLNNNNNKIKTISNKIFETNGYYRKTGVIEKINGKDLEILFEFNDSKNIRFGKDLHIPSMGVHHSHECGKLDINWSVESIMNSVEMALDEGIVIDLKHGKSFNCKINGQYYNVVNDYDKGHIITELKID